MALMLGAAGCDYLYHQRAVYSIEGATLIDGNVLPPIVPSVVVIEDGKITAMGREGEVAIPRQALRIEASGKFVFPTSFTHPLKVGGPGDLYVCDVNPVLDPEYKKHIYGSIDNGVWWSKSESTIRKGAQSQSKGLRR